MSDRAWTIGIVALVLALVGAVAYGVAWHRAHPCIRWAPGTCTETYCAVWMPMPVGDVLINNCAAYESRTYACQRCEERAP